MITSRPDPLRVPAELQPRVEAVPGLRALYRRGSFARTLGLACLAVLPATALLSMIFLQGLTGSPPSAHVPAGYGTDPGTSAMLLLASLILFGGLLFWMGFGLRRVLLNRGVRHFTFSFVIGGSLLVGLLFGNGIVSPDFSRADAGDGTKLDSSQLGKLIDSPGFTTLSPQWQGYLQAQRSLARPSIPLNDIGQAIARGEDIGIAVPMSSVRALKPKPRSPIRCAAKRGCVTIGCAWARCTSSAQRSPGHCCCWSSLASA